MSDDNDEEVDPLMIGIILLDPDQIKNVIDTDVNLSNYINKMDSARNTPYKRITLTINSLQKFIKQLEDNQTQGKIINPVYMNKLKYDLTNAEIIKSYLSNINGIDKTTGMKSGFNNDFKGGKKLKHSKNVVQKNQLNAYNLRNKYTKYLNTTK
jgi:hypothetical protein